MRIVKKVFKPVLLAVFCAAIFNYSSYGQDKKQSAKDAAVADAVNSKKFTFIAQTASPMSGGIRHLTSEYTLKVSGDSVISDLPYFGRAYSAPMDPGAGGFNFATTVTDYQVKTRKKGGWDISIKPDHRDVQLFSLSISSGGSASLRVTSNNRQSISFNGYLKE